MQVKDLSSYSFFSVSTGYGEQIKNETAHNSFFRMSDHLSLLWVQNCLVETTIRVIHLVNNESYQSNTDGSDDASYD